MARDYDRSEAFPPLGARSDTVLVFVSIPGGSVVYAVLGLTRRAGHGRVPARPNQTAARP
jgi:hypothetical protein